MASSQGLKLLPYYLGKKPVLERANALVVRDKYTNKAAYEVSAASKEVIRDAIGRALKSQKELNKMSNFERKDVLLSMARQINERKEEVARVLVTEVGKSITDARGEVSRAIDTFTIAAEESTRKVGEYGMQDISARNAGYSTIVSRFPIGLVSMIVPFNFPINLAAHKIAPAIAVGCPFVLKPSDRTPVSAVLLGEMLSKTSLPDDSYAILPAHHSEAHLFSEDPRIAMVSFTGSAKVGWGIKRSAHKAKVALELGGNAACVIDANCDLEHAVNRLSFGSFYSNGESCISVQRVYIHESVYDKVLNGLVKKAATWKMGDPNDQDTLMGPLITENDAVRLKEWIDEAVKGGGRLVTGGNRKGAFLDATIVENAPATCRLVKDEAFGPVCVVSKYSDFAEVIERVNASEYGLQAGIFTNDLKKAFYAYENLHTGGVVINDVPSARIDSMPYGGVKDSGLGREGVCYTMEDMSEVKVMLMKDNAKL